MPDAGRRDRSPTPRRTPSAAQTSRRARTATRWRPCRLVVDHLMRDPVASGQLRRRAQPGAVERVVDQLRRELADRAGVPRADGRAAPGSTKAVSNPNLVKSRPASVLALFGVLGLADMTLSFARAYTLPRTLPRLAPTRHRSDVVRLASCLGGCAVAGYAREGSRPRLDAGRAQSSRGERAGPYRPRIVLPSRQRFAGLASLVES
jgi:hypothetical protein